MDVPSQGEVHGKPCAETVRVGSGRRERVRALGWAEEETVEVGLGWEGEEVEEKEVEKVAPSSPRPSSQPRRRTSTP
jgi:hypothetical protein